MTVINLGDTPDRNNRLGRHVDFVCFDCRHIWWKMIRSKTYNTPRQECPRCGSKDFAYADYDFKTLNVSKRSVLRTTT